MADRGFTIKDMLQEIGVDLNIPPFYEGRKQLPAEEVKKGRQIASVRIHVERAIGRIKNFSILRGNFPLSMIRLANQIVCICAWLSNFQPALVPAPTELSETEAEDCFQGFDDPESMTVTVLKYVLIIQKFLHINPINSSKVMN